MKYFFCTNCGGELKLNDLEFTICKETNHVIGICPICHWNEFSESDPINEEGWKESWQEYPEPDFYIKKEINLEG